MATNPFIQADKIACIRGGRMIFSGVSIRLCAGESMILRGPNGIGKSSLLRVLAGLIPCFHGRIECAIPLALADEGLALDGAEPLWRALSFWARMDGADDALLNIAMEQMNLGNLRDVPVHMLSTGQRKRAIIARTIASKAPLWLLDEPGNGLDDASLSALGLVMERHIVGGGAIIAASHFDLPLHFTHSIDMTKHQPEPFPA